MANDEAITGNVGPKPTTVNEWNARYGGARRKIDRGLLAETERQLAALDNMALHLDEAARNRIARAFGRHAGAERSPQARSAQR